MSNRWRPNLRGGTPATGRRAWLRQMLAGVAPALISGGARAESEPSVRDGASALAPLLERNRRFRPDFGGGFSNHVSMGLYSLTALGATGGELERFADRSSAPLEPLPKDAGPPVARETWTAQLGQREALNGYRALFQSELEKRGRAVTLRHYLPGLLPGVGAAAFHPLIRTGYGVRFGDDRELADGLAFWATAYLPLGGLGRPGTERDARAVLGALAEQTAVTAQNVPGRPLQERLRAAAALPVFAASVNALDPGPEALGSVAAAAVRLFVQTGDFIALHAVTGTHAFRQIAPFVDARESGVRYLWQALVAAYISIGAPRWVDARPVKVPPWSEAIQGARASLDAHDIKLVDVARDEEAFYRDPIYRHAAARRLRLV